jgi:hypothetical protein
MRGRSDRAPSSRNRSLSILQVRIGAAVAADLGPFIPIRVVSYALDPIYALIESLVDQTPRGNFASWRLHTGRRIGDRVILARFAPSLARFDASSAALVVFHDMIGGINFSVRGTAHGDEDTDELPGEPALQRRVRFGRGAARVCTYGLPGHRGDLSLRQPVTTNSVLGLCATTLGRDSGYDCQVGHW